MSLDKLAQLKERLSGYDSCLVAYSGGVDSVFLAWVAHQVLGDRSLAVIADSPSLPRRELEEAVSLGERLGFPVRVMKTQEFEDPRYVANPVNRCYFCKAELFGVLAALAREEKFAVLAYGENASDAGDVRPGAMAAEEFEVRAPLKEVGLTKAEIRELSAGLGLPTADKPQMACLSSRIPHGEEVAAWKLSMIEAAEAVLRDMGFRDVRVRHHELGLERGSAEPGVGAQKGGVRRKSLARIELGQGESPRLWQENRFSVVAGKLREIGYSHVTVDLEAYGRRGTLEVEGRGSTEARKDPRTREEVSR